jgi:acetyltransferase-like isoleucine patch superfamily enzyme
VTRRSRWINSSLHAAWRWVERAGEVGPGTRAAETFGSFGEGSCIGFPMATLMGAGSIHIGSGTLIGRQVTLSFGYGVNDKRESQRGLVIGDRCVIGARSSLTAHASIVVGDDVWFGQDVFVCDTSHGYQELETPIGQQFGTHQPVSIGSGTWIGHGAIILPGSVIGRNVVVAAGAVVRGTVEDYAVVGGTASRTLRRFEPGVGWVTAEGNVRPVLVRSPAAGA